ncbi:MAG: hypothetical protein WAT12_14410 [Candidatus Nitrotoga sp.]
MKTSKISRSLALIALLLVGTLMSEVTIAADGGHSGHVFGGGGHAGGGQPTRGFSGGGHAGGGQPGRGFSGGGHAGGRYSGGWNRGGRVGIYLGAPIGFSYGYNPYSYYRAPFYGVPYSYPPAYYPSVPTYYPMVQPVPMTYVERSDEPQIGTQEAPNDSSQDTQESWWYYCVDAKAYYPYVNQCPGGWLRVAPQPAPDSGDQPALNDSPAP